MLKNLYLTIVVAALAISTSYAQPCSPAGDQTTYGTGNIWIGYAYDQRGFVNYRGYITAGTAADPSFATHFNGPYTPISTVGCPIDAENFSIRYKLEKNFTPGYYEIAVAGDDVVRFSVDGGATWLISNWVFNSYNVSSAVVFLSGIRQLVLEYEEGAHNNRLYFSLKEVCTPVAVDLNEFGTGNNWRGYVYKGTNFDQYKGYVIEGSSSSLNFSQGFGGDNVAYPTSDCPVETDFFSVRYRLRKNFASGSYSITVSGDDKFRLSINGGSSWVIDRWAYDFGNSTRTYTANFNGTYDLVLDYYEKDSSNSISVSAVKNVVLASGLLSFSATAADNGSKLQWTLGQTDGMDHFELERSTDGSVFEKIKVLPTVGQVREYNYLDAASNQQNVLYYRLKLVESSGASSYSKVISVNRNISGTRIYPTFNVGGTVYLVNERSLPDAQLILKDLQGRTIEMLKVNLSNSRQTTQISLTKTAVLHGWYIIQLTSAGNIIKTEKLYFP